MAEFDRGDWQYICGALLVSAGVASVYWPAGLIAAGAFAAIPPLVGLLGGLRR